MPCEAMSVSIVIWHKLLLPRVIWPSLHIDSLKFTFAGGPEAPQTSSCQFPLFELVGTGVLFQILFYHCVISFRRTPCRDYLENSTGDF